MHRLPTDREPVPTDPPHGRADVHTSDMHTQTEQRSIIMISDELKAAREKVLAAHLKGESDKDVAAVLATMPEPVYDLITVDRVLHGKEEVGRFLQNMFDLLGPNEHRAAAIHHTDDQAIVEVVTVFPDGFDGSEPGQEFRVRTVGLFPFDGATLLAERVYADPSQVLPLLEGV